MTNKVFFIKKHYFLQKKFDHMLLTYHFVLAVNINICCT